MTLDASGNLGLGVTPSAWLSTLNALQIGAAHLFGQTVGTGTVSLGNNAYLNSTPAYIYQYNGKATRYSQYDGQHEFYTAPSGTAGNAISFTQAMTLNASGNLSIGNTNDTYKLDVNGTGRFVNQLRAYNLLSDNQIKGSAYVELSPDQVTYNAWNIRLGAQAADACYYITGGGVNILTTEGYNNPYTVKLYSNGVQTLTMTNGAATFSSSVTAGGDIRSNSLYRDYQGEALLQTTTGAVTQLGSLGAGTPRALQFLAGNNTAMYITTGGNVGIGTTSPAAKFHVSNGGQYGIEIDVANEIIQAYNRTSAEYQEIKLYSSNLRFFNGTSSTITERMRITSGGNVLIGTTTGDGYKLQIVGASQAAATFGQTYAGVAAYSQWVNSSGAFVMGLDAAAGTTERMRITSGGDVLINTTSDAGDYKLQVNGNGYFSSNAAGVLNINITNANASGFSVLTLSNTGASGRSYDIGVGGNTSGQNGNFYIYDNNANSTRFLINSSGNAEFVGSIKTGEPDTGWGRAAIKIGASVSGAAFDVTRYLPVSVDGTVYYINLNSSTP
jgi:hypothetical protein